MIEVTVKFNSMADAAKFFAAHGVEAVATPSEERINAMAADPAVLDKADDKPKRGRKPKTEQAPAEAAAAPAAPEPEPESGDEQPQPKIEDLRSALDAYIKSHGEGGFEKGSALIRSFQKADGTPATRLSEIQEADYVAFVAAAKV